MRSGNKTRNNASSAKHKTITSNNKTMTVRNGR